MSWHVQEVAVRLLKPDWIEKLYFEQFLVDADKNQEKADGQIQVKRTTSKDRERNKENTKRMQS